MSEFYNSIVDTNSEVGKVFENFGADRNVEKWKETQQEFHESIEKDYPAIRCDIGNNIAKEQNPIPEKLAKRIKVTTLLLGILVSGGKYNRKMYLSAVEFCTMSDISKRKFVEDYSS